MNASRHLSRRPGQRASIKLASSMRKCFAQLAHVLPDRLLLLLPHRRVSQTWVDGTRDSEKPAVA